MKNNYVHPVYTGKYVLMTMQIINVYKEIIDIIESHIPGCMIIGRARLGKTIAIKIIIERLKKEYELEMAIVSVVWEQHDKPTQKSFFSSLYRKLGGQFNTRTTGDALEERCISVLADLAKRNNDAVLLFIDEANRLQDIDYKYLMDVKNRLDIDGIQLGTILVGTKELKSIKDSFIDRNEDQITRRFMNREIVFTGINNVKSMQLVLAAYDDTLTDDNGTPFTQYFFPNAYKKGRRLSEDAGIIYHTFADSLNNADESNGIPMDIVKIAIDRLFKKSGINGDEEDWPTSENWLEAIDFAITGTGLKGLPC